MDSINDEGRVDDGKMAASKIDEGTDVNFGELTRKMSRHLELDEHVEVKYSHQVLDFERLSNGKWRVKIKDLKTGNVFEKLLTMYSLVQAVLQFHYYKTGIPESKHLGGFPITGQFLTCTNPQVIEAHDAKVYGKEPPGTHQ